MHHLSLYDFWKAAHPLLPQPLTGTEILTRSLHATVHESKDLHVTFPAALSVYAHRLVFKLIIVNTMKTKCKSHTQQTRNTPFFD